MLVATAAAKLSGDRKILFMLEGAIIGIHEAALPVARRQELAEWADSLTPKQEFPAELE